MDFHLLHALRHHRLGVFLVETVKGIADNPTSGGVIEASGVGVLLGALITWVGITVNYFFRKRPPTDGKNGG